MIVLTNFFLMVQVYDLALYGKTPFVVLHMDCHSTIPCCSLAQLVFIPYLIVCAEYTPSVVRNIRLVCSEIRNLRRAFSFRKRGTNRRKMSTPRRSRHRKGTVYGLLHHYLQKAQNGQSVNSQSWTCGYCFTRIVWPPSKIVCVCGVHRI